MNKVAIFTDSCADLSDEIYHLRNIHVIPFIVSCGGKEYLDGKDISTLELLNKAKELNTLPMTAAPSPYFYKEYIEKVINDGYEVVYIGIGRDLSQAYKNIHQVETLLPDGKFYHFDSMNLSSAIGIQVLKACDLRDEGYSAKEIIDKLSPLAPNYFSNFTVLSLDYLKKGGRVSSFKAFVGSFLKAKPIFGVRDGILNARKTIIGKFVKAYNYLVDEFLFHYEHNNINPKYVIISHVDNIEGSDYIIKHLKEKNVQIENLYVTHLGATIASHSGPKTIGLMYEVLNKDLIF